MQDVGSAAILSNCPQALRVVPYRSHGAIATAGEKWDVQAPADLRNDSLQRILFDPHFRPYRLPAPLVDGVLLRNRADDGLRRGPMRIASHLASTINQRLPINEAGHASITDDVSQLLVAALIVCAARLRVCPFLRQPIA